MTSRAERRKQNKARSIRRTVEDYARKAEASGGRQGAKKESQLKPEPIAERAGPSVAKEVEVRPIPLEKLDLGGRTKGILRSKGVITDAILRITSERALREMGLGQRSIDAIRRVCPEAFLT